MPRFGGDVVQMELWAKDGMNSAPIGVPPKRRSARLLRLEITAALIICDLVFLSSACFAVSVFFLDAARPAYVLEIVVALCAFHTIFAAQGRAFGIETFQFVSKSMNRSFVAIVASMLTVYLISHYVLESASRDLTIWAGLAIASTLSVLAGRLIFERFISKKYRPVLFDRVILIDGVHVSVPDGYRSMDVRQHGIEPDSDDPMMRHWASLYLADADRVIIACKPHQYQKWATFIKGSNVRIEMLMPELNELGIETISRHGQDTTIGISNRCLSGWNRFLKRLFDISVAAMLVLLTAPVMILSALFIKLDDGGSVIFSQSRMGRGNRLFKLYKFRSMAENHDDAVSGRITRVGRYLRASSIDELPQLFNVLAGQMSLVGPRPHALESVVEDRFFWEVDEKYWHRHAIKPGMTGLAQVRGFRGATICRSDLTDRLQSDLEYLRGWTIWRDLTILVSTLRVMIHKNAY